MVVGASIISLDEKIYEILGKKKKSKSENEWLRQTFLWVKEKFEKKFQNLFYRLRKMLWKYFIFIKS